jgi:serine/threonine protein kinase
VTLPSGSRLGPYEILSPLGAGGMGEVYRAKDPRLGLEVAVKVLPTSFSSDPDRLRRFEHEARAAGLLNHPNITAPGPSSPATRFARAQSCFRPAPIRNGEGAENGVRNF